MEIVLSLIGAMLGIIFPGIFFLPFLLKKTGFSLLAILSLIPLISISINYLFLFTLNSFEFFIDLKIVFAIYILVSVISLFLGRESLKVTGINQIWYLVVPFLTLVTTGFSWMRSYQGYNWIAPNADGYAHNLYISRIMELNSVIGDHVFSLSPMDKDYSLQSYFFFYPLGWHSSVAPAAEFLSIPAPTMALSSTLVYWSFVMPLGLIALSTLWFKSKKNIGIPAALISQSIPLVPGVPMTWGAMASVIGISMIPSTLILASYLKLRFTLKRLLFSTFCLAGAFFVHPSEAIYVGVLFAAVVAQHLFTGSALVKRTMIIFAIMFIAFCGLFWNKISQQVNTMSELMGAADRTVNETLGSFLTLSVNTSSNQLSIGLLLLLGIYFLRNESKDSHAQLALIVAFLIYLFSGANTWPIDDLRILTVPWYASYERTSWQLVPVASLIAAVPFGIVAKKFSSQMVGNFAKYGFSLIVFFLFVMQITSGITGHAAQIKKGLRDNQIAGPGSRTLFDVAEKLQKDNSYYLTVRGDGSAYAYMFNGVNVSNGPYNIKGKPDASIENLLNNVNAVCRIPNLSNILAREKIDGVMIGTRRYAWETAQYSKYQIRKFEGFDILQESEDLMLLKFNLAKCS